MQTPAEVGGVAPAHPAHFLFQHTTSPATHTQFELRRGSWSWRRSFASARASNLTRQPQTGNSRPRRPDSVLNNKLLPAPLSSKSPLAIRPPMHVMVSCARPRTSCTHQRLWPPLTLYLRLHATPLVLVCYRCRSWCCHGLGACLPSVRYASACTTPDPVPPPACNAPGATDTLLTAQGPALHHYTKTPAIQLRVLTTVEVWPCFQI